MWTYGCTDTMFENNDHLFGSRGRKGLVNYVVNLKIFRLLRKNIIRLLKRHPVQFMFLQYQDCFCHWASSDCFRHFPWKDIKQRYFLKKWKTSFQSKLNGKISPESHKAEKKNTLAKKRTHVLFTFFYPLFHFSFLSIHSKGPRLNLFDFFGAVYLKTLQKIPAYSI